jgi:hypothetical protein
MREAFGNHHAAHSHSLSLPLFFFLLSKPIYFSVLPSSNPSQLAQMTSSRLHDSCLFFMFSCIIRITKMPSHSKYFVHTRWFRDGTKKRRMESVLKLFIIFLLYTKIAYRHYQQMFLSIPSFSLLFAPLPRNYLKSF